MTAVVTPSGITIPVDLIWEMVALAPLLLVVGLGIGYWLMNRMVGNLAKTFWDAKGSSVMNFWHKKAPADLIFQLGSNRFWYIRVVTAKIGNIWRSGNLEMHVPDDENVVKKLMGSNEIVIAHTLSEDLNEDMKYYVEQYKKAHPMKIMPKKFKLIAQPPISEPFRLADVVDILVKKEAQITDVLDTILSIKARTTTYDQAIDKVLQGRGIELDNQEARTSVYEDLGKAVQDGGKAYEAELNRITNALKITNDGKTWTQIKDPVTGKIIDMQLSMTLDGESFWKVRPASTKSDLQTVAKRNEVATIKEGSFSQGEAVKLILIAVVVFFGFIGLAVVISAFHL